MKLVLLAVLCCLRIPLMVSIDMLNCALGLVEDQLCPEDGGWSQWVAWGQCEGECGSVGRQVRYRNCSNPPPERNGADCEGNQLEVKPCSVPGCSYEQYDKFLAHDAVRQQELINLRKYSGPQSALLTKCLSSNCDLSDVSQALSSEQTKFWNSLICVKKNTGCPEAGGWGDWSPWTRCNARCGSGQRMRCRACCDPPPSSADVTCRGDTCEYQSCTGIECGQPLSKGGDWSQWSDWSACSSPCNFGYMRRTRVCENQPQVLSNEENSALSMSNDYNYVKDNANSEDDYSYAYYDDDLDRTDDNYEDNSHDSIDDMHSLHSRAKRSKTCDKVEYYNNAEEEDIQSTKLKSKVTTRKMERKTVEQILNEGKFTVLGQEKDSWIFKKTDSPNQGKKFYTKIETLITTTPSFGLNTGQPKTKTSKIITRNSGMNEPSNEISDRTITKIPISGEAEVTRKCTKTYPNTEKKGNRVIDPIVLDESQSDGEEKCGELYKNSSTVVPCKGGEEECGELYKNSSTAVPCKGRTNILTITANWQAIWHTGKLNHGKKCSPSMGPSSVQRLKSAKSDVTNNEIEMSSEATVINLEESYSSTALPTIIKAVKSDVSNIKIAMSSETNAVDLEPSSVQLTFKDSRTVTVKETTPIKVPISLPVTSETESVSQKISFPISSRKPTMVSNSGLGLYPTLPLASKASTEKFFRIFPTKNSTPGTDQELPTFKSTSPHVNDDVIEVIGSEKLNISSTRPTTCDLSKKLELPSFSDSFPAESCSGSFEEVKPCNTHLCDEDGGWSDWSSWSPCASDCDLGLQVSVRSCTNPEPRSNGSQCQGEATRHQSCYLQPCPVTLRTTKAVFMTGDSVVKYEALRQHSSILLLYVRFRHFSPTGSVVARRPHDCIHDQNCNHVTLSLYRNRVLVSVLQQKCHTNFLASQRLSIGDWHEIMLTIVGVVVTLRLDDSVLNQKFNLSCSLPSPNYDADMKVGGTHFVGEVDRLIVNFKNYVFQKKREKREAWKLNDDSIAPMESSQVQYEVNSRDVPTASLTHFLQAPCFTNHSSWNIDLALKPNFPDGLVLFMKGYDSRDFLFVSLEQTRIRLRVRAASQAGECEHPEPVAPLTWVHLGLSRPPEGPVGLSVNGGPRCVVSLAPSTNNVEEPEVYCTGGILLGEMPLRVKTVLSAEAGHSEPIHSPLGLLGHLSIDNHTLDLTRLPRKIAPDLTATHPEDQYRLSSHTAATTVYYEEMLVLEGERLSMPCIYDLSPENISDTNSIPELDINWYKLDISVKTLFSNESGVHYETPTTGKAISLNITSYPSVETVQGYYSCWLHYPLPLQSGLNIVTYGVIIISATLDKRTWLFWLLTTHLCLMVILLVFLVLWLVYEVHQDYKQGSGYYRCKKLKGNEAYKAIQIYIFSDKAINRLGGLEAAEKAFERYSEFLEREAVAQALREAEAKGETATETDITTDNEESHSPSSEERGRRESVQRGKNRSFDSEIYHSIPNGHIYVPKNMGQGEITVGMASVEFKPPRNESRVTIEELLQSDSEETNAAHSNGNLIDVSKRWNQKELIYQTSRETTATGIGQIQNTHAYRSIENELKFKPDKFKNLGKYMYSKKNKNST